MYKLILIRHGQSTWNLENRFTGWTDVGLTPQGEEEGHSAGRLLREAGYVFDQAVTSVLKRAVQTLWIVLQELGLEWIPVTNAWQLNERHYGALQGLNKAEMAEKYGEAQVKQWRRSYDIPPPPLEADDPRHPRFDARYAKLSAAELPSTESLKMTLARVVPFWESFLVPRLRGGQRILVSAHGNSMRALIKHLDQIPDDEISELNIPTGVPLVYEFDPRMRPLGREYLGNPDEIAKAVSAVANQGKKSAPGA